MKTIDELKKEGIGPSALSDSFNDFLDILEDFSFRRMGTKAVTATARKIATLCYKALHYGMNYVDLSENYYEEHYQKRLLNNLSKRAAALGYVLQKDSVEVLNKVS